MSEQRFRFRLPWLQAAAGQPARPAVSPAPRPPTTQPSTTPRAPPTPGTQVPPTRPRTTPTPSPTTTQTAPAQPASTTTASTPTAQTAETEAPPPQSTPSPTTAPQAAETPTPPPPPSSTTAPVPTAERPPFRPPGVAPSPPPQTSRTQLQPPPSPSRSTTQPRSPSQPPSPSRSTIQPQTPSQPPSPSRSITQPRTPSQPQPPGRVATQSRAPSQPSTPPRRSPQPPRTATQPRSPSLPSFRPSEQTSSPPSPSRSVGLVQTTTEAGHQPTSPLKEEQSLTKESSQPSEGSTEAVSSISDIQETKSKDVHPKAETISAAVNAPPDEAPLENGSQLNEMKQQPSQESGSGAAKMSSTAEGPKPPAPKQVLNISMINPEPELFPDELKSEETKEVTEVTEGTKDRSHEEARNKESNIPEELGNTLQTKGTSVAFQSISASNGRQTKITTAQPRNKSMPVDNHQKHSMHNGEHIPLHKEIREDISKLVQKMTAGESKQSIDDRPVSVVTLAGENRGATMHLGSDSSRKGGAVHIHRGYKIKPDDTAEATTDGEQSSQANSNNNNAKEDQPPEAYVNSNVQGLNNSITFNSSITERNPGVHFIHSNFPIETKRPSAKTELMETRKAEFNVTPSRKLTHEPVVRRRCLRGLFMESSDSDPDNTKPSRHGCRVACNEKKENNIDVL